jgi:hypothetical protein
MLEVKKHSNTPLVETKEVIKHYPVLGGVFLRQIASVKAVDGVSLRSAGRNPGPGGRIRLWQIVLGRLILHLENRR